MNVVKVLYNPYLPELKIRINDSEITRYSSLHQFINKPFTQWNDRIFNEIFREVNDSYYMEFQSCSFECEIMESIAQLFPECIGIQTSQTEINISLQERLSHLEGIAGAYIDKQEVSIHLYSEQTDLAEALCEMLVDNGLFEPASGSIVSESYPLCDVKCFVASDLDDIELREGLHFVICDGMVDEEIVANFKQLNEVVIVLQVDFFTSFSRKENNVYIYSIEAEEVDTKLTEIVEGFVLRDVFKELYGRAIDLSSASMQLTRQQYYRLRGLAVVERDFIVEYPSVIYRGRTEEVKVIELPGALYNQNCVLESQDNETVTLEEMRMIGKKPGVTEVEISLPVDGVNKRLDCVEIQVIDFKPIEKISIFPKHVFLAAGMVRALELTFEPENAENSGEILWRSSNENVACVKSNGVIVGQQVGNCEITAYTNETACTVQVEVQPSIESIILPSVSLQLVVGEKIEFKYRLMPENCYERELIKIHNSNVNVIDYNGIFITAKGPGNATLTVYTIDESLKRTCIVEVKKKGLFR